MPVPKPKSDVNTSKSAMETEVRVVSQPTTEELAEELDKLPPISMDEMTQEAPKVAEPEVVESKRIHVNDVSPAQVDDILAASIIARPLTMPDFLDQRAKDPKYRLRWVNYKANGGARYDQMRAAGFRNAIPEEVIGLNSSLTQENGSIRYNDTILMIIPAEILLGAYKHNYLRSQRMVSPQGAMNSAKLVAEKEMSKGLNELHISPEYMEDARMGKKVNFYTPQDKQ